MVMSGMPAIATMSPGTRLLAGLALERLGDQELGDLHVLLRAVALHPGDGLVLPQGALVHAHQREPAEERAGVEVGDVCLQGLALGVDGSRDGLQDRAEQRLEVRGVRDLAVGR